MIPNQPPNDILPADIIPADLVPATSPSAAPGDDDRLDAALARTPRQVTSAQLLGQQGELVILHGGRQYRLRITQNGKLILTA